MSLRLTGRTIIINTLHVLPPYWLIFSCYQATVLIINNIEITEFRIFQQLISLSYLILQIYNVGRKLGSHIVLVKKLFAHHQMFGFIILKLNGLLLQDLIDLLELSFHHAFCLLGFWVSLLLQKSQFKLLLRDLSLVLFYFLVSLLYGLWHQSYLSFHLFYVGISIFHSFGWILLHFCLVCLSFLSSGLIINESFTINVLNAILLCLNFWNHVSERFFFSLKFGYLVLSSLRLLMMQLSYIIL